MKIIIPEINKKAITITLCLSISLHLCYSQQRRVIDCGTRTPPMPFIVEVDEEDRNSIAVPVMMKIFVHIFADNNGTNVACGDSSILRQLENMQEFFEPHSICFQLLGIQVINSTDLNSHNTETEETELGPFLVSNSMNIFVHRALFDNEDDLNGSAYGIPNSYLSVSRAAIISIANRSTLAHEMGHCLGLYHTFETAFGEEEVPRNGDCKNCTGAGDFICDTKADPHSDSYDTGNHITESCIYTGSLTKECDDVNYQYNMDPHNIMAYGRRSCRDLFTNGQGARMTAAIATFPILANRVSPSSVILNSNSNVHISNGTFAHGAESSITVQGNEYEVSGSAHGYFNATSITIKPNVHLHPGAEGFCTFFVHNPTCD